MSPARFPDETPDDFQTRVEAEETKRLEALRPMGDSDRLWHLLETQAAVRVDQRTLRNEVSEIHADQHLLRAEVKIINDRHTQHDADRATRAAFIAGKRAAWAWVTTPAIKVRDNFMVAAIGIVALAVIALLYHQITSQRLPTTTNNNPVTNNNAAPAAHSP